MCMLQASPKNSIPYDIWINFVQNNPWHKQPISWRVKIWSRLQSSIWLYPRSYCSHHVTTKLSDSHEIPWTRRTWSLNMLYMTCFRDFTSLPTPYQHPFIFVINTLLFLSSYIVSTLIQLHLYVFYISNKDFSYWESSKLYIDFYGGQSDERI